MLHNWRDAHNTSEVSDAQQLEGILNNWRAFSTIGGMLTTHQKLVMLDNWRGAHNTSEVSDARQLEGILDNWRDAHNTSEVSDA